MSPKNQEKQLPENTQFILELFDFPDDRPKAIALVPQNCSQESVIAALKNQKLLNFEPNNNIWRQTKPGSLANLAMLYDDWDQTIQQIQTSKITILMQKLGPKPAETNQDNKPRLIINDPASFVFAEFIFPKSFRNPEIGIHSHLSAIQSGHISDLLTENPNLDEVYAVRWTINGIAKVFFFRCPKTIPAAMLHSLLKIGTVNLSTLANCKVELAGPAIIPKIESKQMLTRWDYSINIRKANFALEVFMPDDTTQQVLKTLPNLTDQSNQYNQTSLLNILAVNRQLLDTYIAKTVEPIDINNQSILSNFWSDNLDNLSRHDLRLLVQNYLLPKGNDLLLDYFFPLQQYDSYVLKTLKPILGEQPIIALAYALKQGKNVDNQFTLEMANELIAAINTRKLALSMHGTKYILSVLGNSINNESQELLEHFIQANLPLAMLEMIPPPERMKALSKLTDRERSMCLFGDKKAPQVLMAAFSPKGKQREQDDYNLMVKLYERGEITAQMIIQAKTEACQFIAEHYVTTKMAKASDLEWKKIQEKLPKTTLFYLVTDESSCLNSLSLKQKLLNGISPIDIKIMNKQISAEEQTSSSSVLKHANFHMELLNIINTLIISE